MNDKVVQLPGKGELPENLIEAEDRARHSYCQHGRITLDNHQRTVNCRDCGRVLDPFQFLQKQADLLQQAWLHHDMAKRKVKELNESIGVLTKEYQSLKGKVARLKDKLPTVDVRGKDRL